MRLFQGFLLSVLVASSAIAAPSTESAQASLAEIAAQQTLLRAEVAAGRGAFKDMDKAQRDQIVSKQDQLLGLVRGKADVSELSASEKMEVMNSLEWINAGVAKAESERKVCERVKVVGSNRPQVICTTMAERRKQREAARDSMSRPQMCTTAGCAPAEALQGRPLTN